MSRHKPQVPGKPVRRPVRQPLPRVTRPLPRKTPLPGRGRGR